MTELMLLLAIMHQVQMTDLAALAAVEAVCNTKKHVKLIFPEVTYMLMQMVTGLTLTEI